MTKEIAVVSEKDLAELKELYPTETGSFQRITLPRIGFASQDKMEGTGKNKKVTIEAGTFLEERETDEVNDEGKKVWGKKELGTTIEGVILWHRYQLSFYDEKTEMYSSTPVYDNNQDEVLPLFCDKKQVAKGTPAQLKKMYEFVDQDGKSKSKLKDNRILYVLVGQELFQMNLHGSSMWSFMKYAKIVNPPSVVTTFSSEPQEKGQICWNQMSFKVARPIKPEETQEIIKKVKDIKMAIALEKGNQQESVVKYEEAEKEFENFNKPAEDIKW